MLFPLRFRPHDSYHEGQRRFGANRPHGRLHAGCDLYAPVGTEVLAVADGTVVKVHNFYHVRKHDPYVWYVEIDHGSYVIRYGEVSANIPPEIKPGHRVARGQIVGKVGRMAHITHSMLHFEMYSGEKKGDLTDMTRKPFMRRSDLVDPTSHLDAALVDNGAISAADAPIFVIGLRL